MARRSSNPKELPDAVREAVERPQATVGSAERTRETVDELVKGSRKAWRAPSTSAARPPTTTSARSRPSRAIGRRLDAIEERLPAKRKRS